MEKENNFNFMSFILKSELSSFKTTWQFHFLIKPIQLLFSNQWFYWKGGEFHKILELQQMSPIFSVYKWRCYAPEIFSSLPDAT